MSVKKAFNVMFCILSCYTCLIYLARFLYPIMVVGEYLLVVEQRQLESEYLLIYF